MRGERATELELQEDYLQLKIGADEGEAASAAEPYKCESNVGRRRKGLRPPSRGKAEPEGKARLSKAERLFCRWYCATGNARESAARAGFVDRPEEKGLELLTKERIICELKSGMERERELLRLKAMKGLERIAFGSVSDSVRLICGGAQISELDSLDLFLISEIKKPKDGAMEIKFFDRLKALERLAQDCENDSSSAAPFFNALNEAARAVGGGESDNEI